MLPCSPPHPSFYDQSKGDQVDIGTYTPFQGLSYDLSKVIWWGGRTTVPAARPEAFTSNVVMRYIGVILSILTLLWVLIVVALTVYWRNTKLMKWSSPVFMCVVVVLHHVCVRQRCLSNHA